MNNSITIALAGNPNSGKTTIFNQLTGSRQHVGNYPGVTVEKKEGKCSYDGLDINIVDLPGTYSLTANSIEEVVARNFLLDEKPDVVIDIIDSANLERNLYLAVQLIELGVPLLLAFNMTDISQGRGLSIDIEKLSQLFGVPIIKTVGNKAKGIDGLLDEAVEIAKDPEAFISRQRHPSYGHEVEPHVQKLTELITEKVEVDLHKRWFALKLLAGDKETVKRLRHHSPQHFGEVQDQTKHIQDHIHKICGDLPGIILADRRYGFISGACTEAVTNTVEVRHARSDQIDAILTHRWLGMPIFALMMYLVFQLTFAIGGPIVGWLEVGKTMLADFVREAGGQENLLMNLLANGIIEGVGAVIVFVPFIVLLFLGIAFLEDTGYMARAAFLMDRLMHKIGLHGKSFIPMLIGFGCSVPGIMATRMLETRRDRLTTMIVLPLMSCGARLPVYVLILGAFFPKKTVVEFLGITNQALLLWLVYLTGIVLAIVGAKILRGTVLKGETTPFVMELPPYRLPTLRGLVVHMWERAWMYVRKAGTLILVLVVILWALGNWPGLSEDKNQAYAQMQQGIEADSDLSAQDKAVKFNEIENYRAQAQLENSAIGQVGKTIAPVLAPCGFDWKISTAMVGAFVAKEVFIGQMGVIYALGESADETSEPLRDKLASAYHPLQGFCIMLFILIASPCVMTVAITIHESGTWKWALFQWVFLTALAWVITAGVYQVGSLFF